jgi:methionyl-tRNA formyltransferase
MNIVFFGSANFSVPSLKALLAGGHRISCVLTQPDRQKGRGLQIAETAVKKMAKDATLNIYQPPHVNTDEVIKFLKTLSPDLFVVVAYGQILSQEILDIPKIFSINAHASLLPRYRGAAPINWSIINGDSKTGITIIKMIDKMDAGPIISQETLDISEDDTSVTLEEKLSSLAAQFLLDAIKSIENKDYHLTAQDETKVSLAPKLKKEDGQINWNKSAQDICNLIRGVLPWPGAFTYYNGKLLKIYRAEVIRLPGHSVIRSPAQIIEISKEGIVVSVAQDNLIIEELQIEGKKRMDVKEFIAGHKICVGDILGTKK